MNSNKNIKYSQKISQYLKKQMSLEEKHKFEEEMSKNPDLKNEVEKQSLKSKENKPDFITKTLNDLKNEVHEIPKRRYHFGQALLSRKVLIYFIGIVIVAIIISLLFLV